MKRLLPNGSFNVTLYPGDPKFFCKRGDFIKIGKENFIVKKISPSFVVTVKKYNPYVDYTLLFIVCFWLSLLPLTF